MLSSDEVASFLLIFYYSHTCLNLRLDSISRQVTDNKSLKPNFFVLTHAVCLSVCQISAGQFVLCTSGRKSASQIVKMRRIGKS